MRSVLVPSEICMQLAIHAQCNALFPSYMHMLQCYSPSPFDYILHMHAGTLLELTSDVSVTHYLRVDGTNTLYALAFPEGCVVILHIPSHVQVAYSSIIGDTVFALGPPVEVPDSSHGRKLLPVNGQAQAPGPISILVFIADFCGRAPAAATPSVSSALELHRRAYLCL